MRHAVTTLAPTQEMQWELMLALAPDDPGSSRVLIVDNRYLDGELDLAALRAAFGDVTRRHEALRLVFDDVRPDPVIRIADEMPPPVEFLDLSGLDESEQLVRLDLVSFEANRHTFDLRGGPLWHAWVVRLRSDRHLLNLAFSHLIADGAACRVFVLDLVRAYLARRSGIDHAAPPVPSFADLHELQNRRYAARAGKLDYWRERLTPAPPEPVYLRRATPDSDLLARGRIGFDLRRPETVAEAKRLAWRSRTTPFVVLLAGYALLLSLVRDKERISIASGTLSRPTPAERRTVMQFVSDPYVCPDMPGDASLGDVVWSTHRAMTDGIDNLVSFQTIARAVNPDFDHARPYPDYHLCDGHFYSQALHDPPIEAPGLRVTYASIPGSPPVDFRSDLLVGSIADQLQPAWEAWCGPSVAVNIDRDGAVMLFNDRVYPMDAMRDVVDEYLDIVEIVVWHPGTTVGELRRRRATRAQSLAEEVFHDDRSAPTGAGR
jgi:hypothetical protein